MSDRASSLVSLGKPAYLAVPSMPDLFHFVQPLAIRAGAYINRVRNKSLKQYQAIKSTGAYYSKCKPFEDNYLCQDAFKRSYRKAMNAINKAIHPFDEQGSFARGEQMGKIIWENVVKIEEQLIWSKAVNRSDQVGIGKVEIDKLGDGLPVEIALKLDKQVGQIKKGVKNWQEWTIQRMNCFIDNHFKGVELETELRNYLLHDLLPWVYWQVAFERTPSKKRNKQLRVDYQNLITRSAEKYYHHRLTKNLTTDQMQWCLGWAEDVAQSFQRSSSQVEGRNGYLAFIHKANRGLPENRLKVLTVIHNYDIRRTDGSTPAQRLFKRDFPDLFEFVLQNVTGFPEPKQKKPNSLCINTVQA